jgi:hypothetical protein
VRVGSGEEEAVFSGGAVLYPLQPSGQDIYFLSGAGRRQAFASRDCFSANWPVTTPQSARTASRACASAASPAPQSWQEI